MTDQPTNPSEPGATSSSASSSTSSSTPPPPPVQPRTFEQRVNAFGRQAGEAGERLGREAEAAADRWKKDPGIVAAGDTLGRVWGLLVLAVGLWFFADITLDLDMPAIAWREVWPIALIVLGLAVLIRGMAGRRA